MPDASPEISSRVISANSRGVKSSLSAAVTLDDANQALNDMLFTGGRLNSALLGGSGAAGGP
jgi:hypothetical protein